MVSVTRIPVSATISWRQASCALWKCRPLSARWHPHNASAYAGLRTLRGFKPAGAVERTSGQPVVRLTPYDRSAPTVHPRRRRTGRPARGETQHGGGMRATSGPVVHGLDGVQERGRPGSAGNGPSRCRRCFRIRIRIRIRVRVRVRVRRGGFHRTGCTAGLGLSTGGSGIRGRRRTACRARSCAAVFPCLRLRSAASCPSSGWRISQRADVRSGRWRTGRGEEASQGPRAGTRHRRTGPGLPAGRRIRGNRPATPPGAPRRLWRATPARVDEAEDPAATAAGGAAERPLGFAGFAGQVISCPVTGRSWRARQMPRRQARRDSRWPEPG